MAGIGNGMTYHGGVRAFVATFFNFSDYMRPSVRLLRALGLPVIYVRGRMTPIGLGEDGPTPAGRATDVAAGDAGNDGDPSRRREQGAVEAWRVVG
jgi:hypothetical protein